MFHFLELIEHGKKEQSRQISAFMLFFTAQLLKKLWTEKIIFYWVFVPHLVFHFGKYYKYLLKIVNVGSNFDFFLVKTREYSCNQKLTKENKCINIDPKIGHECERNKQRYYICLELLVKHKSILFF